MFCFTGIVGARVEAVITDKWYVFCIHLIPVAMFFVNWLCVCVHAHTHTTSSHSGQHNSHWYIVGIR